MNATQPPDGASVTFRPTSQPALLDRLRVFLRALAAVAVLSLCKLAVNFWELEFLTLNSLLASAIGGAIFILGFLLRSVLADYKEAERLPGELRVSLEAIHDDVTLYREASGQGVDVDAVRDLLKGISRRLRASLRTSALEDEIAGILMLVDRLSLIFVELERLSMPANYIVRLRGTQDQLRRSLFRIYHVQRMQFVPSAHILAQSLVVAVIGLMLSLRTAGSPESALIFAVISYMLVFVLFLIDTLEVPFGDAEMSFDDVSLFLLREFEDKLEAVTSEKRLRA